MSRKRLFIETRSACGSQTLAVQDQRFEAPVHTIRFACAIAVAPENRLSLFRHTGNTLCPDWGKTLTYKSGIGAAS